MKKTKKVVEKFLAELERTPIVGAACEKTGLSRNTVYRWRKEDREFAAHFDYSLSQGIAVVSDVAESNVLNGIKNKDAGYTKFWLSSRHPAYRKVFFNREEKRKNPLADPAEQARVKKEVKRIFREWDAYGPKGPPPDEPETKKRKRP